MRTVLVVAGFKGKKGAYTLCLRYCTLTTTTIYLSEFINISPLFCKIIFSQLIQQYVNWEYHIFLFLPEEERGETSFHITIYTLCL
jgi:hypothetical protein